MPESVETGGGAHVGEGVIAGGGPFIGRGQIVLVAGCTAGQLKQVLPRLQEILANAHNGAQRLERLHSADAHPNKLRRITPRGK